MIDAPRPGFMRSFRITAAFLLLAFFVFLPVVFVAVPNPDVAYAIIAAYIFFASLVIYAPLTTFLRGHSIRSIASSIGISGGYFYVPSPIPAEFGYVTVVRRAEGLHRSFSIQRPQDFSKHPLLPEAHLIVIDRHGNGKIVLPGYRLSGKYDGILVLFFVPYYAVEFEKTRLTVQSINDIAEVFLQPSDFGFNGYLRASLSRGVGADAYISWKGSDIAQFLAVSGQVETIQYPTITEPTIIVTHEDYLRPELLAEALGVDVLVQGTGSFFVTLRVRFPMETDLYDYTQVWISSRVGGLS